MNNFRDTEFDIWNVILGCLNEDWNNVNGHCILLNVWHDSCKGVEAAHSVVVALLITSVVLSDNGNELVCDPVLFELFSQNFTFLDSHLTNTCGSVG